MARYAVISDIHGNLHALKAVLDGINTLDVDDIICLGDVVGYGPDPRGCLDLVNRNCGICVMGNHDLAVLDPAYTVGFNEMAKQVLSWTRDQLDPMHLDSINRMRELEYVGQHVTCVHDNPQPSPMTYIYNQDVATLAFRAMTTPICLVGHTHMPMIFETLKADVFDMKSTDVKAFLPRDGVSFTLDQNAKTICNPGSVGQPRDGDSRASFAVIDLNEWTYTIHRQHYDIAGAQLASQRQGLPDVLAQRLAIGA
ncbi:MAG: metallophosphoesterase family protein [Planctomycetota bacterium]|nr:metallophosphoesterase family protein [Planctomycetota bacterium]